MQKYKQLHKYILLMAAYPTMENAALTFSDMLSYIPSEIIYSSIIGYHGKPVTGGTVPLFRRATYRQLTKKEGGCSESRMVIYTLFVTID